MFKGWLFCIVCMGVVALVSDCFMRNKKSRLVKVLAVLEYMYFMVVVGGFLGSKPRIGAYKQVHST